MLEVGKSGVPTSAQNSESRGMKVDISKREGMIKLGWEIQEDPYERNAGRRIYKQQSSSINEIITSKHDNVPADLSSNVQMSRKKKPDIPEEVKHRIYGLPGHNIFTYELDKPRPCRTLPENLDIGMIPKEVECFGRKKTMSRSSFLQGSLEDSLIPKEGHTVKANTKRLSSENSKCNIEPGYTVTEVPKKTTKLSPMKYATNLGVGLLPVEDNKSNTRRHFSSTNSHCYDCR
ncbi:hypothetical protein BgAZ_401390 [Babesia gibsoni]|uniref:Uncharacterized protein n=1 Tax=Babesia gibsoni TaxID=33632 RepID=A0AAD8LH58_BABGI|nr:hypothetical protein BgAZ_401390 [Babesia gibsoni]